jgi:hypothetical protein
MDIKQVNKEQRKKNKGKMGFPGKLVLLCSLFIVNCSFVMAQNSGYFLDTSGGEPLFTQRLSWAGDEYVRRYEVIIEKREGEGYRELRRESAREPFIEVSLSPGAYRCYVTPYDFLGLPGERSEIDVEVLPAFLPGLDDSSAEFVYPAKTPVYEMSFSGRDIVPGAEIYLRGPGGELVVPSEARVREDGGEVRLFFDRKQISSGDFELVVKNPGGLETSRGGITVTRSPPERPTINAYLGAAWMPLSPVYQEGEDGFPGSNVSAAGAAGRLGAELAGWDLFSPGLELAASWCLAGADSEGREQSWAFGLNLLARKWFPGEKTAFTFRVGAGYTVLPDWQHVHVNTGVSFLWVFALNLYVETGLDYSHWFTESPFGSGCLRPWVGLGWRF